MDLSITILKDLLSLLSSPLRKAHGWWKAPSLDITFSGADEPWVGRVADAGLQTGWFYRLGVTNRGRSVAEGCIATLLTVEPVGGGPKLGRPGVLKWAHEATYDAVDIEPDDPPRKLDLLFILEQDHQHLHFYIDMPNVPVGFTNVFDLAEYDVGVRVKTKGGVQAKARFRLVPGTSPGAIQVTKQRAR